MCIDVGEKRNRTGWNFGNMLIACQWSTTSTEGTARCSFTNPLARAAWRTIVDSSKPFRLRRCRRSGGRCRLRSGDCSTQLLSMANDRNLCLKFTVNLSCFAVDIICGHCFGAATVEKLYLHSSCCNYEKCCGTFLLLLFHCKCRSLVQFDAELVCAGFECKLIWRKTFCTILVMWMRRRLW